MSISSSPQQSSTTNISTTRLNVSQQIVATHAEGPGLRYAIWVQGCSLRCLGCCNPQMFSSIKTNWLDIEDILEDIRRAQKNNSALEGISILGGEPVEQPDGLFELCRDVQMKLGLSVMVFTGYLFENLILDPTKNSFLSHCDILVDGPFDKNLLEQEGRKRKWIGSQNQNIHILSDTYPHLQNNWPTSKNTVEIRMKNGEITINGFPFDTFATLRKQSKN